MEMAVELGNLPEDCVVCILGHSTPKSIGRCATSCQSLYQASQSDALWRGLCLAMFTKETAALAGVAHREQYKRLSRWGAAQGLWVLADSYPFAMMVQAAVREPGVLAFELMRIKVGSVRGQPVDASEVPAVLLPVRTTVAEVDLRDPETPTRLFAHGYCKPPKSLQQCARPFDDHHIPFPVTGVPAVPAVARLHRQGPTTDAWMLTTVRSLELEPRQLALSPAEGLGGAGHCNAPHGTAMPLALGSARPQDVVTLEVERPVLNSLPTLRDLQWNFQDGSGPEPYWEGWGQWLDRAGDVVLRAPDSIGERTEERELSEHHRLWADTLASFLQASTGGVAALGPMHSSPTAAAGGGGGGEQQPPEPEETGILSAIMRTVRAARRPSVDPAARVTRLTLLRVPALGATLERVAKAGLPPPGFYAGDYGPHYGPHRVEVGKQGLCADTQTPLPPCEIHTVYGRHGVYHREGPARMQCTH